MPLKRQHPLTAPVSHQLQKHRNVPQGCWAQVPVQSFHPLGAKCCHQRIQPSVFSSSSFPPKFCRGGTLIFHSLTRRGTPQVWLKHTLADRLCKESWIHSPTVSCKNLGSGVVIFVQNSPIFPLLSLLICWRQFLRLSWIRIILVISPPAKPLRFWKWKLFVIPAFGETSALQSDTNVSF